MLARDILDKADELFETATEDLENGKTKRGLAKAFCSGAIEGFCSVAIIGYIPMAIVAYAWKHKALKK